MLNLKKTAVAVLALGSSAVFAGTMGPVCTPGSVTIPCEHSAWDFAGQALYLKSSYSNAPYFGSTVTNGVETFNRQNTNWGWGFKLEGSYHFSTGNDLNLNWYHWNRSANQAVTGRLSVPNVTATTTTFTTYAINGVVGFQPKWDAVNLEFGQHVDLGEFEKVRFHGGFQYARIQTRGAFSGTVAPTVAGVLVPVSTDIGHNSTYNGFGPRVGADMSYNWGNGFGIYANAASALLVGSNKVSFLVNSAPTGFVGLSATNNTSIVPEMEAKVGATYTYAMAQGDLSLDAGWMWVNYFNAQIRGIEGINGTAFGTSNVTDFGVQGPYIGLKWVGNVV